LCSSMVYGHEIPTPTRFLYNGWGPNDWLNLKPILKRDRLFVFNDLRTRITDTFLLQLKGEGGYVQNGKILDSHFKT
jgi:hypothetical protein